MTLQEASTNIVFIDTAVIDYQSLLAGIILGSEVVILDHTQDALTQITEFLAGRQSNSVQSVHIVSHGGVGSLQLGSTNLNLTNLNSYTNQLQKWKNALTDNADILLYGCDVASGEGTKFVQLLSQITGTDVAASIDKTGSAALGGDWDLEFSSGKIETSLAFKPEVMQAYKSILPVSFTGTYSQNFDSLANSGTSISWADDSTIAGWYATRTSYIVDDGSDNTGALYSFGSTSSTERALGSVASGTTGTIYYGLRFTNNTSSTITALKVGYTGEQWRNGNNLSNQKLNFTYQTGTPFTNLTTGTWTPVTSLDFTGPIATTTPDALDGNVSANRVSITPVVFNLTTPIAMGGEIILRWKDINDPGKDHGLAIDDVSVNLYILPKVNFGAASYNTTEGSTTTTVTIAITLDATPETSVSVPIIINNSSTATAGDDYTFSPATLTFTAGATGSDLTQLVTFTINLDDLPENAETVVLNFGTLTGADAGTITETTLNIAANDSIEYAISTISTTLTEGNSGTQPVTFIVVRSGGIGVTSTVDYAISGTALFNSDYNNIQVTNGGTASSGTLNFAVGETTKTITVDVLGDNTFEPDENITVTLSNPNLTTAPETSTITNSFATANIINDDNQPTISISNTFVYEGNTGATNANFDVTLSNASHEQVTVNYNTSDGTAKVSDFDYTSGAGTIIFAAGETSKNISFGVIGDRKFEINETFNVNLFGATNATITDSLGVAVIVNDDDQPRLSISDVLVNEGSTGMITNAKFVITLTGSVSEKIIVNYSTTDGTAKTSDSDYNFGMGAIIFNPGETSKILSLGVRGDIKVEANETFFVNLYGAANAIFTNSQGIATIKNDDR